MTFEMSRARPRCGVLGKEMWDTREQAAGALRAFARTRGSQRVHGPCVFCGAFHLTKSMRGRKKGTK